MKKLLTVLTMLSFVLISSAQNSACGTKGLSEEKRRLQKHYGNNRYITNVLRQHNFNIPQDYFDSLDSRGLYKGRELKVKDVKPGNRNGNGNGNGRADESSSSGTIYYVPIKIWHHKNSSGVQAMSNSQLEFYLNAVFETFRVEGTQIEFWIKDIDYINNSPYFNLPNTLQTSLMSNAYYDQNAMNMHIVETITIDGEVIPGYVPDIGYNVLVVDDNPGGDIFIHELGHALGLEHTHHGRGAGDDDNEDRSNCYQESVSRTRTQGLGCVSTVGKKKCEVNGDYLCDTPGEPNLGGFVTSNCSFNTNASGVDKKDNWSAFWVPNTNNIMSYSLSSCVDDFTWGQIGCMLGGDGLGSNTYNFKSTSAQLSVSGSTNVCPNQSYTYSIPAQSGTIAYIWQVTGDLNITSGQGTRTINVSTTSNGYDGATVYVNVVSTSGGVSIAPKTLDVNDLQLDVLGPSVVNNDGSVNYYSTPEVYGPSGYSWTVPSGWSVYIGQGSNSVQLKANSNANSGNVQVSYSTVCGQTIWGSKYVTVNSSGGGSCPKCGPQQRTDGETILSISPNPFGSRVSISGLAEESEGVDIVLYEMATGRRMKSLRIERNNQELNLSDIPRGIYLITYNLKGKSKFLKILKQ